MNHLRGLADADARAVGARIGEVCAEFGLSPAAAASMLAGATVAFSRMHLTGSFDRDATFERRYVAVLLVLELVSTSEAAAALASDPALAAIFGAARVVS